MLLLSCQRSLPLDDLPVPGDDVRVTPERQSSVEHVPEVLAGAEGGEPAPVGRPLPHAVGGLVGHQDPGHPRVPGLGVPVGLPVEVGQVEHQGRGLALPLSVPGDPTVVRTLT